jgi:sugar (pentulose or hexulose) kinase
MPDTVLCVDIGTTSLKAGLFTADGEAVFLCRKSFPSPDDRFVAKQWLEALKHCLQKIKMSEDEKIKASIIKGICVSGAGPTVVLQNGLTVRWNEPVSPELKIPENLKRSLFIPKILTAKTSFPDDFEKSDFIFSGPEYLIYELTGKAVTILPEARFEEAYWNDEAALTCGVGLGKLPGFCAPGTLAGELSQAASQKLQLAAGIPVFCGAPDFVVALIGTNTLQPGRLCDRAGSSEGFNFCTDRQFFTPTTRTLPSVISGLWNVSVLSEESGRIFVEYKHRLEKERGYIIEYPGLVDAALKNPESEGGKIICQILEQVKASVEKLKDTLTENGIAFPASMCVTGGQAKNDLWMQKKADTLGMTLEICNCADSELTGDACAAWFGLGVYGSLQDAANHIVKVTKRFIPNESI